MSKMERHNLDSLEDVFDIVGLIIFIFNEEDLDRVKDLILSKFEIIKTPIPFQSSSRKGYFHNPMAEHAVIPRSLRWNFKISDTSTEN